MSWFWIFIIATSFIFFPNFIYLLYRAREHRTVIIQEIVGPNKAEILREEVKRIVLKLPKFEPAKHKGNIVKVKHSLPLTFKLQ